MMKQTKESYYKALRQQWQAAKILSQTDKKMEALYMQAGQDFSFIGFCFVMQQMNSQGLDGLPHIDAKTFKGWKDNGFRVKKGEKSSLSGVTWITCGKVDEESDEDKTYRLPKQYYLFHRTQVQAI